MQHNTSSIALVAVAIVALFTPDSFLLAQQQTPEQQRAAGVVSSIISPLLLGSPSGPGITAFSPLDGATNVELGDIFSATFSKPVATFSVNNNTFYISHGTNQVAATVILDQANNQAKLVTQQTLALQTQYTVTLDGITDLSGNPLPATSWTFTTRDGAWLPDAQRVESNNAGAAGDQRIAVDPQGNAVAIWEQYDATGSRFDLWSNHYQPGIGWGIAQLVETDDAGDADNPAIAIDPSGTAIAVWRNRTGVDGLWSSHYVPGTGWDTPVRIEANSNGNSPRGQQIVVEKNGNAIAIWRLYDGTRDNIWWNRYTTGSGWGTAQLLETTDIDVYNPTIAMDANGNAMAVWVQTDTTLVSEVWASRYTPGGWGTAQLLGTDNANEASGPDVAFDRNGNAIAIWIYNDGSIWANRYTPAGEWDGAQRVVENVVNFFDDPKIALDDSGNAIAVWSQSGSAGGGDNIASVRYQVGSGWGSAVIIDTPVGGSRRPDIALDSSGNAVAVWEQSDVNGYDIWANRYVAGAGWSEPIQIEMDDAGSAYDPQVAVDGYGNMLSVWYQFDGTRDAIYFNRFGGGGEPNGKLISQTVFADPLLGDCVRAAAVANSWHFAQEVTELDCSNRGIRSLGGLHTFVNLELLNVGGNPLDDLTVIARMPVLRVLDLQNMPNLTNIDVLTSQDSLTNVILVASGGGAIDCGSLNALTLKGVSVVAPASCRQRIADAPLPDPALRACALQSAVNERVIYVDQLEFLDCERGGVFNGIIKNLAGVQVFQNLKGISIDRSDVQDLSPLAGIPGLKRIDASSSYVTSLKPLSGAPAIEVLVLKSVPLLYSGDPTGISVLSSMPALREVYLDEKDYCDDNGAIGACVTGAGQLDCQALDALDATLPVLERPRRCNMTLDAVLLEMPDANLQQCIDDARRGFFGDIVLFDTNEILALDCRNRSISQLNGLGRFGRLNTLKVAGNPITDLAPVNGIVNLRELDVSNTQITDFDALSNLDLLQDVFATNIAGLTNIHALLRMARLGSSGIAGTGGGGKVDLTASGNFGIPCADLNELQKVVVDANAGELLRPSCLGFSDDVLLPSDERVKNLQTSPDSQDDLILQYAAAAGLPDTAHWDLAQASVNNFLRQTRIVAPFDAAVYSRARGVALGDADGDGDVDLLLQLDSAVDDSVTWRVELTSGAAGSVSLPDGQLNGAHAIAFNDVNGDNFADILIEQQVTLEALGVQVSVVDYYLSMGTGTGFAPPELLYRFDLIYGRPRIVALEDVNNDGKADLVYDVQSPFQERGQFANTHCFGVRIYGPSGFSPTNIPPAPELGLTDECFSFSFKPNVAVTTSVADIDGDDVKELVVSLTNQGDAGTFGHLSHDVYTFTLNQNGPTAIWDNFARRILNTPAPGTVSEYRTVVVADLDQDRRADVVVEVTDSSGAKNWIGHVAKINNGLLYFEQVDALIPPLAGSSEYRLIDARNYVADNFSYPDLLFLRGNTAAGSYELHVAKANLSSLSYPYLSPTLWHDLGGPTSPLIIGNEDDGLTNLANDTSELIAWAGVADTKYTKQQLAQFLGSLGMSLLEGADLDVSIPSLGSNTCVLAYGEAGTGDGAPLDGVRTQYGAKAQFGLLACNYQVGENIELKSQAIYGGCAASAGVWGGGAKCEVGLARGSAEFTAEMPAPVQGLPVAAEIGGGVYTAGVCAAVSPSNLCLDADATFVSASGRLAVGGVGVGGEAGLGFAVGADAGIEDGVISGKLKLKFLAGGSVNFRIDTGEVVDSVTVLGNSSYTYSKKGAEFVVFTAGPAVHDSANKIGGAVLDQAGQAREVVLTRAGEAVYFFTRATNDNTFIVFPYSADRTVAEIFAALASAASSIAAGATGVIVDLGGAAASAAAKAWDYFF